MSIAPFARIRAAAAAARTPAKLDRLRDEHHQHTDEHRPLAQAAAGVAGSVFAASQALEQVAAPLCQGPRFLRFL